VAEPAASTRHPPPTPEFSSWAEAAKPGARRGVTGGGGGGGGGRGADGAAGQCRIRRQRPEKPLVTVRVHRFPVRRALRVVAGYDPDDTGLVPISAFAAAMKALGLGADQISVVLKEVPALHEGGGGGGGRRGGAGVRYREFFDHLVQGTHTPSAHEVSVAAAATPGCSAQALCTGVGLTWCRRAGSIRCRGAGGGGGGGQSGSLALRGDGSAVQGAGGGSGGDHLRARAGRSGAAGGEPRPDDAGAPQPPRAPPLT
jgi:hypothetical protein